MMLCWKDQGGQVLFVKERILYTFNWTEWMRADMLYIFKTKDLCVNFIAHLQNECIDWKYIRAENKNIHSLHWTIILIYDW